MLLLSPVPAAVTGTVISYAVDLSSNDTPAVTGTSGVQSFPVGQAAPTPDANFTVVPANSLPGAALQGSTIVLAANASCGINLTATFSLKGTYNVADPVVTGTGWAAVRTSPATVPAATNNDPPTILKYTVTAGATAVADGTVAFQVRREGGSATPTTVQLLLKRG